MAFPSSTLMEKMMLITQIKPAPIEVALITSIISSDALDNLLDSYSLKLSKMKYQTNDIPTSKITFDNFTLIARNSTILTLGSPIECTEAKIATDNKNIQISTNLKSRSRIFRLYELIAFIEYLR